MDFVEQRRFTRDEIIGIFRVPKKLLGLGESSGLSDREDESTFAEYRLKAICKRLQDAFNRDLFDGVGYYSFENIVPVNIDQVRADYRDGLILKSEARTKLGYSFLEGSDAYSDGTIVNIDRASDTAKALR